MKTYIDSDGVLSDFHGWVTGHNGGVLDESIDIDRFIVDHYKTCYIDAQQLPGRDLWFLLLATDPDWYVLSSVGTLDRFLGVADDLSEEEVIRRYNILIENKYRWFEERGVPRDKVILVGRSADKVKYCQPGDILYDDFNKTLDLWAEAGGLAIKVYNTYKDVI